MPFQSKAQRRKFYALKSQGKMDQATIDKWEDETPKTIPERVKPMSKRGCSFYEGFLKRAAEKNEKVEKTEKAKPKVPPKAEAAPPVEPALEEEAPVDPAAGQVRAPMMGQPVEKTLKWDALGGVAPRSPEDMQAATAVDLITLPADVDGAHCGNCMHVRILDEDIGHGFCTHPEVKQDVTPRMCCARWEHPGQIRSWEQEDASAVPDPSIMGEAQMMADGNLPLDPAMTPAGQEQGLTPDGQPAAAPGGEEQPGMGSEEAANGGDEKAEPDTEEANAKSEPKGKEDGDGGEPKSKPKSKAEGGNKHTINIHVGAGGEKKASAFFRGFGR